MVLILVACTLFPNYAKTMTAPFVWGGVPKAQDDSQTIDDAIAAAVSAHNDDPDAHMAAGQSIDVHRTNDILDHPQGSVLADKGTQTEWVMTDSFATTDVWDGTNATKVAGTYGLLYYPTSSSGTSAKLIAGIPFWDDLNFGTKEIVLQFGMYANVPSGNQFALFGAGTDLTYISSAGLGIKVTNTQIQLYQEAKGTRYSGTAQALDTSKYHIVRIHLSPADNAVYLYVDGVLVDTMAIHLGDDSNSSDVFESRVEKNGAASLTAMISIYNLYLSHQAS
jgi:hypothetical protein